MDRNSPNVCKCWFYEVNLGFLVVMVSIDEVKCKTKSYSSFDEFRIVSMNCVACDHFNKLLGSNPTIKDLWSEK